MLIQEWLCGSSKLSAVNAEAKDIKVYIHTSHGPSVPKIETLKEILKKTLPNGKSLLPTSAGFDIADKAISFQHDYLFVDITIGRTLHLHEIKTIVDAIVEGLT